MVLDQKAFAWEFEVRLNELFKEHNVNIGNPQEGLYVVEQYAANSTLKTPFTDRVNAFMFAIRLCFEKNASNYPLDNWDNLRLCKVCKQYECVAPATKCWRCREQEVIDEH